MSQGVTVHFLVFIFFKFEEHDKDKVCYMSSGKVIYPISLILLVS